MTMQAAVTSAAVDPGPCRGRGSVDPLVWTHDDRPAMSSPTLSVTELARRIRDRELSPVEVIEAAIERIEARDADLGAFVFRGFDEARASARAAEAAVHGRRPARAAARRPDRHEGPVRLQAGLAGDVRWRPRRCAGTVIDARCVWVERIERDGAIVMGKTNSPVMGFRGTCDNPLFGPTRNPFDTSRNAGGSSGGSAAAVADGLVPFAEGTDAGGSIRIPAAWCGTYGFKPSWGRVPTVIRPNGFSGTDPFVAEGTLTRTVADAALVMQTLAGYDSRDPYSLPDRPDLLGALGRRPARACGSRRARTSAASRSIPRIAAVVADAVRAFEEAGAVVEPRGRAAPRRPARAERPVVPPHHAAQHRHVRGVQGGRHGPAARPSRLVPAGVPALDRGRLPRSVTDIGPRPGDAQRASTTPSCGCSTSTTSWSRPTVGRGPGAQRDRRRHAGPDRDRRRGGGPAHRLVPDVPASTSRATRPHRSRRASSTGGCRSACRSSAGGTTTSGVLAASAVFERLRPWEDIYAICRQRVTGGSGAPSR